MVKRYSEHECKVRREVFCEKLSARDDTSEREAWRISELGGWVGRGAGREVDSGAVDAGGLKGDRKQDGMVMGRGTRI